MSFKIDIKEKIINDATHKLDFYSNGNLFMCLERHTGYIELVNSAGQKITFHGLNSCYFILKHESNKIKEIISYDFF